jgi:integrase
MTPDVQKTKRRRRKILTDREFTARTQPGTMRDSEYRQLELRIRDSGAKAWAIRYYLHGKQRRFTIGEFPAISVADARQRAKDALRDIEDRIDPAIEKRQRRDADTFDDLARDYIEKWAKPRKRSWKEDQRILNANILPHWKHRAVRDITRRDIRELIEAIADRGAPTMANRVRALLSKLFRFAIGRDVIELSPMVGIERPADETPRDRVLTDDEIRQFWTATEALDAPMRAFFRLRLLTAQRGIEVSTMKWGDVDLEGGWWTVSATVAKNKLSHRVPLSQAVIDLLKELPRDGRYVLDGARGKRQQAEAAATFAIDDFKGHDLRRTAASRMASAGIPRLHIGKVLNHVETGVTAVYDRHGYDAEKRVALDTWARVLNAILKAKPADVLPFTKTAVQ